MGYLYNGVRLPKLPEWDKEKYPYAYITSTRLSTSTVWYLSLPREWGDFSKAVFADDYVFYSKGGARFQIKHYDGENMPQRWGSFEESESSWTCDVSRMIWSNTDACTADGTILLAASDPIPVHNPAAIVMGYSMGGRL